MQNIDTIERDIETLIESRLTPKPRRNNMSSIIQDVRYGVKVNGRLQTGHYCYAGQHQLERALDSMVSCFMRKYADGIELVKYAVVETADSFEDRVIKEMTIGQIIEEEESDLAVLESSRQAIREWRAKQGLSND